MEPPKDPVEDCGITDELNVEAIWEDVKQKATALADDLGLAELASISDETSNASDDAGENPKAEELNSASHDAGENPNLNSNEPEGGQPSSNAGKEVVDKKKSTKPKKVFRPNRPKVTPEVESVMENILRSVFTPESKT
ncbi:hypothetical protein KC19_5G063300 [Ceratodon purpureus]|uniref:Uncharacterized protein n=1 Tax=Ceratodon purpureus TaxID=3225 RepID=A0A8T0I0Y8_CERPU|nr:hypothetical protein KC19_5G063300 [Ceratodon purpureus]